MKDSAGTSSLNRREFLKYASAAGLSLALSHNYAYAKSDRHRPNILFIMTDQQSVNMMSCRGNKFLKTPAMDSLAASGMSFTRTYATNPVCVPSRVSIQTGVLPSTVGMRYNEPYDIIIPENLISNSLGALLKNAGYDCGYGGKVHLPANLQKAVKNDFFEYFCEDERDELAVKAGEFIKRKRGKPFFCFASFINPHDICFMAINSNLKSKGKPIYKDTGSSFVEKILSQVPSDPEGFEKFVNDNCPPLPDNFEIPENEPRSIDSKYAVNFRKNARQIWTKSQWRLHRWLYCRLTEVVDAQIAQVLKALRDSGQEDNTIIIFTSDHGDMDSSHRLEHKDLPYEECACVPLIFVQKGFIKTGVVDNSHLISNGLDLLPTICDLADIKIPEHLPGRSLKPLLYGKKISDWRDYVIIETHFGTALCDNRFKYSLFEAGKNDEMLVDLKNDPGEMHNLACAADNQELLKKYRKKLSDWAVATNNKDALGYLGKLQ